MDKMLYLCCVCFTQLKIKRKQGVGWGEVKNMALRGGEICAEILVLPLPSWGVCGLKLTSVPPSSNDNNSTSFLGLL